MIRIFLVGKGDASRVGFRSVLADNPALSVIGEAAGMAGALATIDPRRVDIAVVEPNLPDGSGLEFCRRLQTSYPSVKSIIFTAAADVDLMTRAALAGAAGYLTSNLSGDLIGRAIHAVSTGRLAFDHRVTETLIKHVRQERKVESTLAGLTPRELTLFHLVGNGLTSRQIAQRIEIAEKTVRNNLTTLYVKLGVENRSQLAALSATLRDGLLHMDTPLQTDPLTAASA